MGRKTCGGQLGPKGYGGPKGSNGLTSGVESKNPDLGWIRGCFNPEFGVGIHGPDHSWRKVENFGTGRSLAALGSARDFSKTPR